MFYYSLLLTVISVGLSILPLLASMSTGNLAAQAEKQVSDRNEAYMTTRCGDPFPGRSLIETVRLHSDAEKRTDHRSRQLWGTDGKEGLFLFAVHGGAIALCSRCARLRSFLFLCHTAEF